MFKIFFQRIFMLTNIFRFFCKRVKSAREIPACNGGLKNQICSGRNSNSRKVNLWKIKYEISTDLPSARARRFESDERDLSPARLTFVVSSRRSGWRRALHVTPHLLRISSFGLRGRRFFWLWFWCTLEWASMMSLLDHETLLFHVQKF